MSESTSNRPVKTFRHQSLQVSIWKNYNDNKPYYNAVMEHRYNAEKDPTKPADWKSSATINYRDMPAAALLWQRASNYIAHALDTEK